MAVARKVNPYRLDVELLAAGVPRSAFAGVGEGPAGRARIDWTAEATPAHRATAADVVARHVPAPLPRLDEALVLRATGATLTGPQAAAVSLVLDNAETAARARLGW